MNNTSKGMMVSAILAAVCARGQVPEISNVTFSQDMSTRAVTIQYRLSAAPGIVTVDVRTNNAEGTAVSIGDANITFLSGDVNTLVEPSESLRTITWLARKSWPDHKITDQSVSVKVTAWATNTPPDYLVADLLDSTNIHYYTSAEALPDGGLSNAVYRTTRLVMRRIHATGITWPMGARGELTTDAAEETPHNVTLSNDYYIGIFECTQAQWNNIKTGEWPSYWHNEGDKYGRPVEQVSYNMIRSTVYPAAPATSSFLGILRTKTGLTLDLPSEAQWEFACRAGCHFEGKWGDGSSIQAKSGASDTNLAALGRYVGNGGRLPDGTAYTNAAPDCTQEHATAIAGGYHPNDWGLYDMHGNIKEWCLDFYAQDIAALNGAVNTGIAPNSSANHVMRGGSWLDNASDCRSARRFQWAGSDDNYNSYGFRIALVIGQ